MFWKADFIKRRFAEKQGLCDFLHLNYRDAALAYYTGPDDDYLAKGKMTTSRNMWKGALEELSDLSAALRAAERSDANNAVYLKQYIEKSRRRRRQ